MVDKSYRRAVPMLLAALWCGAIQAQVVPVPPDQAPPAARAGQSGETGNLARGERRFMEQAARHGRAEIELGNLAQTKAASDRVKEYARRMVQDHSKFNEQLKRIAAEERVTLPGSVERNHERLLGDLQNTSGADFDRRFITEMLKVHEKDLKDYRTAAREARDPELKAFAEKAAQAIQEHLAHARQIAETVVGASGPRRNAQRSSGASAGASAPASPNPASSGY